MVIMIYFRSDDSGIIHAFIKSGRQSNFNSTDLITIILMTLFYMIV